jgi:hypothetical protein
MMAYHQGGIVIGNGALMSQHNQSPREVMSQEGRRGSSKKGRVNSQKSLTNIQLNLQNKKKLHSSQGEDDETT